MALYSSVSVWYNPRVPFLQAHINDDRKQTDNGVPQQVEMLIKNRNRVTV